MGHLKLLARRNNGNSAANTSRGLEEKIPNRGSKMAQPGANEDPGLENRSRWQLKNIKKCWGNLIQSKRSKKHEQVVTELGIMKTGDRALKSGNRAHIAG
jgi:hypothetical protein